MLKSETLHLSESIMPLFINLQHMKKKGMLFTILLITWVAFQAWTQEKLTYYKAKNAIEVRKPLSWIWLHAKSDR